MKVSSGVIGSLTNINEPINIFGGGICGLLFAYKLKANGYDVRLYEKEPNLGGKIQTKSRANGIVETGANAIFSSPEVIDLLDELEIDYITASKNLKRYIFRDNKARSNPLYFKEILTIILNLFKRLPRSKEISVYDFFEPLLGKKVCEEVLGCAFNGIYATSIKELDFNSIFKAKIKSKRYIGFFLELKKKRKKKNFKAQSLSFKSGMSEFILKLKEVLKEEIYLNTNKELDPKELNIVCTDSIDASILLKDSHSYYSELLEKIEYTNLNSFTVFSKQSIQELEGAFGILFPYSQKKPLGILNNTAIFENRSKSQDINSYTFITKSHDLGALAPEYIDQESVLWARALPVYNLERTKIIKKLRAESYNHQDKLIIFGNYVDGISIREMLGHIDQFVVSLCQNERQKT